MSHDLSDRYKYSKAVSSTDVGSDVGNDSKTTSVGKEVVMKKLNDYGGQTRRTQEFRKSGNSMVLYRYTDVDYDENNRPIKSKTYDSKGKLKLEK